MALAGSKVIWGLMPITASGSIVNRYCCPTAARINRCFHQGECVPDTHSLAPAEWIVRKLWEAFCESILPALRTEFFRFGKVVRVAVIYPLTYQHRVTALHAMAAEFNVGCSLSSDHVHGREQAHRLGGDSRCV